MNFLFQITKSECSEAPLECLHPCLQSSDGNTETGTNFPTDTQLLSAELILKSKSYTSRPLSLPSATPKSIISARLFVFLFRNFPCQYFKLVKKCFFQLILSTITNSWTCIRTWNAKTILHLNKMHQSKRI